MTPTSNVQAIQSQHFEHKIWMNELNFFEDEVKIYEHQLEELVKKDNREMMPQLEHFQNSFIRQKEVLDQLKHDIHEHERKIAGILANVTNLSDQVKQDHEDARDQVETFKKIFNELKGEYLQFLRKYH